MIHKHVVFLVINLEQGEESVFMPLTALKSVMYSHYWYYFHLH